MGCEENTRVLKAAYEVAEEEGLGEEVISKMDLETACQYLETADVTEAIQGIIHAYRRRELEGLKLCEFEEDNE